MQVFYLLETVGLVDKLQGSFGLFAIVGAFQQVLIEVDFANVLVVLDRLPVHYHMINNLLWRHRWNLDLDILILKIKLLHSFHREMPPHRALILRLHLLLLLFLAKLHLLSNLIPFAAPGLTLAHAGPLIQVIVIVLPLLLEVDFKVRIIVIISQLLLDLD